MPIPAGPALEQSASSEGGRVARKPSWKRETRSHRLYAHAVERLRKPCSTSNLFRIHGNHQVSRDLERPVSCPLLRAQLRTCQCALERDTCSTCVNSGGSQQIWRIVGLSHSATKRIVRMFCIDSIASAHRHTHRHAQVCQHAHVPRIGPEKP